MNVYWITCFPIGFLVHICLTYHGDEDVEYGLLVRLQLGKLQENNPIDYNIDYEPIVEIQQGKLQGKVSKDYFGRDFLSFQGIPFAQPPLGNLRFQAPKPPEKWNGILNVTALPNACVQIAEYTNLETEMSEDCLYLNVYTSQLDANRPVMVYIHGGALTSGQANMGPEFLIHEDIVLVLIQYRLNIFGFFSLSDPLLDISENNGFKDQVMALKWVQQNIHAFGGDKTQVTIFGESAGASSVQLLYVSPMAKGLFHRAIAQSGSASLPWLTNRKNRYRLLADRADCKSRKSKEVVDCLRKLSAEKLNEVYKIMDSSLIHEHGEITSFNSVYIETPNNQSEPFLVEDPEQIMLKGDFNKVPFMTGYNTHEGNVFQNTLYPKPNFVEHEQLIPKDISVTDDTFKSYKLGRDIQEFYYGKKTPGIDTKEKLIDYFTDLLFLEKIYRHAKQISNYAPVYFYHFDYFLKDLNCQSMPCSGNYVNHAAELSYLFYTEGKTPKDLKPDSLEYIGIHRMVKLFTEFAKSGNPNPVDDPLLNVTWKPMTEHKLNYLYINNDMKLLKNPCSKRMQFWEQIYNEA